MNRRSNADDPDATIQVVSDSKATQSSRSGVSKDSLIQSLNSSGSNPSYLENGDYFPDSETNIDDVFRSKDDKEGREDSSILGDDMSLSVATSADFSFATQNTINNHYPAQYHAPQPLKQYLLDERPMEVGREDDTVREANETEGQKEQKQKKVRIHIFSKERSNKKTPKIPDQMFCGVVSGVGNAINTAVSSVNSCFSPTYNYEKGKTGNKTSEMGDFFSPCYRANLDSTSEGDDETDTGASKKGKM